MPPQDLDRLESDEPCADDETCPDETFQTASPVTAAALDLAARSDDGWALQEATACFDGDACGGGLFGAVPFGETNIPSEFIDINELIDGYHQKTVRRAVTPEAPSDTVDNLFFRFTQPSAVEEFEANIRGLIPPDANDRSDEIQAEGVSFAFSYTGPTADIPDPTTETVTLFAKTGNVAILSSSATTSGNAIQGYTDREFRDLIDSFARGPLNLDLELLAANAISIYGSSVRPEADQAVTVLDGQTLPRDVEPPDLLDFRLLTDVGTIHALRTSQIVESPIGPVNVVKEVREFTDETVAGDFVTLSLGRVNSYFGESLLTFLITEFDGLGDQGTGFIYLLNLANGGINGGVTGYARLGTLVSVTNVNVRTDAPPSPDLLARVQDGRYFANPGVEMQRAQIERWIGLGSPRSIPVPAGLLGQ